MRMKYLAMIAACCVSGCSGVAGDPYARPGTWNIEHVNEANLAAMVVNPGDLQRGHGDGTAIGETAATAIERLRAGRVKSLPYSGVARLSPVNSSGGGTQ